MPVLLFTVNPTAVGQLHDMLACLAKFNEDISLEATASELRISSLNVAKTAHASFSLSSNVFFAKYHFSADQRGSTQPKIWACKLQNRALASVFRKRVTDGRDKDAGIERCEFELQARADLPECRLIVRLICRLGVVKTYRLTYETGEMLHASFDKANSLNTWTVSAKTLADVVEYFGPKTEQLDWFLQDGKVTFTSYTEKVQSGREILKQPMHTSVALEKRDFDECSIDEGLHIGIVVKDFRAIVAHAGALQANVNARYSRGTRPMQISYSIGGVTSEFTLMTRGTSNVPSGTTPATPARNLSTHVSARNSGPAPSVAMTITPSHRPAPTADVSQAGLSVQHLEDRPREPASPPATAASLNPDSLFIPAEDDDQQWDEPNYEEEEQDFVTWDASAHLESTNSMRRARGSEKTSFASAREQHFEGVQEIAPTQRLSQVKGLFD